MNFCNFCVTFLVVFTITSINATNYQPRIVAKDGHLIIEAASDRNVSFKTEGKGRVHVNGIDISKAAEISNNALEALQKYKTNFDISAEKISKFEELLESSGGGLYPGSFRGNTTISAAIPVNYDSVVRSVRRLTRRVTNLQRKVRLMQVILTNDECVSNPCKNGGTCQNLYAAFMCQCPPEWEGPTCQKDVNECARFAGTDLGCQNGATCINRPGTYECLCTHGWLGLHCTRRSADCNSGSSSELCGHGTCINQNNEVGYKCICDEGWTTDAKSPACTIDVNECSMNKPPCSVNPSVPCINLPGSFHCGSCPVGYTGNGYYCADIDECATNNGLCSTNPMVQCINTLGSRVCGNCPPGYVGDGVSCNYQGGACSVNNGGCHPSASCRDNSRISSSFVQCVCPAGYVGNGIGPAGCVRSSQYSANPCLANPCIHGTCQNFNGTADYLCICSRRFTGKNCDVMKDLCTPNPCLNGGTCHSFLGSRYRCTCTPSYTGRRCEEERQACGGRLISESGTLVYPTGISQRYNPSLSCAWIIETNTSQVLNITFKRFKVEPSPHCQYDWLQIHDGKNTLARSLGRFCGSDLPNNGTIVTTHNIVYLWFRTDHSVSDSGFELSWDTIDPVCGRGLEAVTSHGSIQSPGSPGNYPNNRDCDWFLMVPYGKRILFHFFTLMIGDSSDCSHDYLEFRSGFMSSAPLFAKFCNTSRPTPVFSPGSEAVIHFHSDSFDNYPGFQITYSVVEGIPGCGGVYTTEQGEIRSPTFEGKYPSDLMCEFKIQLDQKSRIKLTFLQFSLEQSDNCQYDSVTLYAGGNTDAPLIGRYCGTNSPPSYTSEDTNILIVFKTDLSTSGKGFVIRYEALCGGVFTESSGLMQSPMYPHVYPKLKTCLYEISQPLGTSIIFEVLDLDIESNSSPHCVYDYLEIRDGDNVNSSLVGRYCDKKPPITYSSLNYMWIKFATDANLSGRGFKANYTTVRTGCGGILKHKSGTISPPDSLPSLSFCMWVISAPVGSLVQLMFLNFRLEQSYKCTYDYLEVFDNNTESGMGGSMGKFCGLTTPPLLLSSSNVVTVIFSIDNSVPSEGFLINYAMIEEKNVCGGNFYTDAGLIKSPNFPLNYPPNMECSWTISVQPGQQIMLNVEDFAIEQYSSCRYDFLEIHNGGSAASPLLGKFCGTDIPKKIPSHTNKLFIRFKSDMTKTDKGFKIYWDSTTTGCGGTLRAPTGSVISPYYPEPYNSNAECLWKISVSAGSVVQLVFSDLELEHHVECMMDYVEIFDGASLNSESLGRFCSGQLPIIKSTTNHVTIKFRSDVSQQGRGFQLQYTTLCNNTLTGFRGVIESPNFPNAYQTNLNCNWDIKVASHNKINISFSHFELERVVLSNSSEENCIYDYVEVQYLEPYNEYEEPGPYLQYGKYCGYKKPPLITINSDQGRIHFVTDNLLHGLGFRLEWQIEGCGGVFKGPNGSIQSPNYPKPYPASIECNWLIQTDFGTSIEIVFPVLNIEKDSNCQFDFIKIFNGEDDSYPEISQFCHQTKPTTVSSSGNAMFIRFKADSSFQGTGFISNFTSNTTKCGRKFTSHSGSIMSPNYPKNYDLNDTCGYLIEIEEGHTISLKFEDLDIIAQPGVSCAKNNNSYIKVFDGPTAAYPVLAKVCGKGAPNETYTSTYNMMFVEMVTQTVWTAKGFLAKYHKSCGSIIQTSTTFSITLDPEDWTADEEFANCTFTIISQDPSKHVSLTITNLDTTYAYCGAGDESKPIQIFNGESSDSPLIGTYCGSKIPPSITSDGSALHIAVLHSSWLYATYSVYDSACGGTLIAVEGFFTSPGYPKKYPANAECEWTIQIPEGNHVNLGFSYFNLLQSEHCNTDFLEVRQNNSSGKLLGVFCGNDAPANVTNVGTVWILLKTTNIEMDSISKGFSAEYHISHDNELSGPYGVIASPILASYMETGSSEITYKINVEFNKRILITFKEININIPFGDACYSALYIYDGASDSSPSLGDFCGQTVPDPIKSTSNVIFLKAISYGSAKTSNDYRLEWLQIDNTFNLYNNPTQQKGKKCGSQEPIDVHALKNYTIINSPGYPYGYGIDLNCEWIVNTIPMNHLMVYFKDINLERTYYTTYCYSDFVEVYQKKSVGDWELMKKICQANETYDFIHGTNLMKFVFKSNRYLNGTGFSAVVSEQCGGALSGPEGYIVYNNETVKTFLSGGVNNRECQWNITVSSGKTIEIEFESFSIVNIQDKCNNYIILRNGLLPDSPILGSAKYCTDTKPPTMRSTSNTLSLKSVGMRAAADFKVHYREVSYDCGGEIILDQFGKSRIISTPNYPNIPPPHIECIWLIIGPPAEILRVDFLERFDLKTSSGCSEEYVEIRDGGTILSPLVGKFCENIPSSQFTTDNMMFVKFFTATAEPSNGFKAQISFDNCGGTVRGKTGSVQSPFFNKPNEYLSNVNCTWNIIAPSDHTMKIEFTKIDLEPYSNCNLTDRVTISEDNKLTKQYNTLGVYCGKTNPQPVESSSNEVVVNFKSDKKLHSSGFALKYNASQETCGGVLQLSEGFIQSPNYPQPSQTWRRCRWLIKVPKGRRISLKFVDSALMPSNYLNGLLIYNGDNFKALIARFPSDNSNSIILNSTDNTMFIYYWSSGVQTRGFKAKFTSSEPSACRGDFNRDSGVLQQPLNVIGSSFYCIYAKENNEGTLAMSLTMVANSTAKRYGDCSYAMYSVLVTTEDDKNIISSVCTTTKDMVIRSPHRINKVRVYQLTNYLVMNYTISYSTHRCGGVVSSEIGNIQNPNYPNKPQISYECSWLLKLPKEQNIQLTFNELALGSNCEKSYIDIYNGKSRQSPKIGRYCQGNVPTGPIQSQTNFLLIEYKFDKDASNGKFDIKYEPDIKGCGGVFHDRTRVIQSPNYPKEYPGNSECLWELQSEEGYHIGLTFISRVQLEKSEDCVNDFLEIWDWKNDSWSAIKKICGRDVPPTFNSTSNKMKILFRSNDKISGSGFRAQWEWNCGGKFNADTTERFIVSPGFPNAYSANFFCQYNITAPIGMYMKIHFYEFELEKSPGCRFDNFSVVNYWYHTISSRQNYNIVGQQLYCGTDAPSDIRMSNTMYLTFRTDRVMQRSGYKFSYRLEDCGGNITTPQAIESPALNQTRHMNLYQGYTVCVWNITAPPKKVIIVQFEKFKFQYHRGCYFDNVEVFDGNDTGPSNRIANLCGDLNENPPSFRSKDNRFFLRLNTDNTMNHAGFKASIYFAHGSEEGCGGNLNVTKETELRAPNLGQMDCSWILYAPSDSVIKLKFSNINLPKTCNFGGNSSKSKDCDCGFIVIKDGLSPFAETIEKICGVQTSNFEREFATTGGVGLIRVNLATSNVNDAFKLTATPAEKICGHLNINVTGEVGILTSPNYPNSYPANIRCTWVLKGLTRFLVHFEEFDLIEENNEHYKTNACNKDKLQIIDDPDNHVIISNGLGPTVISGGNRRTTTDFLPYDAVIGTHQFCGKYDKPFDYYTNREILTIKFSSGSSSVARGKGFKLEYQSIGCNRNYTSAQGRIVDQIKNECFIQITVDANSTISLFFLQFVFNQSPNCEKSGLEIHEGVNKQGKSLLKACGYTIPNPVFSTGNKLWIHKWNDHQPTFAGNFDLVYTSSDQGQGCGGTLYNYKGRFTSPMYPVSYIDVKTCIWDVRVPVGMRVAFKLSVFDLLGECSENYLTVTTFEKEVALEHKFCKDDTPAVLYSSNHLSVTYQSSLENKGRGWIALFEAVSQ